MTLISLLLSVSFAFAQNQPTRLDAAAEDDIAATGDTRPIKPATSKAPVARKNNQAAPARNANQAPATRSSARAADGVTVNSTTSAGNGSVERCLVGLNLVGAPANQQIRAQYRNKNYAWDGRQILDLSDGSLVWTKNLGIMKASAEQTMIVTSVMKSVLLSQFEKSSAVEIPSGDIVGATALYSEFSNCKGVPLKLANGKTIDSISQEKLAKIRESYPSVGRAEAGSRPAQNRTK